MIPRAFDNSRSDLAVQEQNIVIPTEGGQMAQNDQSRNSQSSSGGILSSEQAGTPAKARTKLDFSFSIPSINLELFDAKAVSKATLHGSNIAKFRMSTAAVTYKADLDGSVLSEVSLKAVTMSNTQAGSSIFREIIPADHDGNQL